MLIDGWKPQKKVLLTEKKTITLKTIFTQKLIFILLFSFKIYKIRVQKNFKIK